MSQNLQNVHRLFTFSVHFVDFFLKSSGVSHCIFFLFHMQKENRFFSLRFSFLENFLYLQAFLHLINQILHTLQSDNQSRSVMQQCRCRRLDHTGYTKCDQSGIDQNDRTVVLMNPFHQSVTDCF